MKEASPSSLVEKALAVLARFPWVMGASLLWTINGLLLARSGNGGPAQDWLPIHTDAKLALSLAIGLLFALHQAGERHFKFGWQRHALQGGGALVLAFYVWGLGNLSFGGEKWIQFKLLFCAVHLFVAFSPFLVDRGTKGFWQYNQALFIRIVTTVIFSGVLLLGLWLAMLAVQGLLNVDISFLSYANLAILIFGIFNTWFFLAGVPTDFAALETEDRYPGSVRILAQYLLIPLVGLNLAILYVYALGVLVSPEISIKASAGYAILGACAAGMLSLLLLEPAGTRQGALWVKPFARAFYHAQLPLLILLLLVKAREAAAYGLDVHRYFFIVLPAWAASLSIFFTVARGRNIKAIPVSLCLLLLLCSFGPWGAWGATTASMFHRLKTKLTAAGLMHDGKVVRHAKTDSIPEATRREINKLLDTLIWRRKADYILVKMMPDHRPAALDSLDSVEWDRAFKGYLGFTEYVGLNRNHAYEMKRRYDADSCRLFAFSAGSYNREQDVSGFDFFKPDFDFKSCMYDEEKIEAGVFIKGRLVEVKYLCKENVLVLRPYGGRWTRFPLDSLMGDLEKGGSEDLGCGGYGSSRSFPGMMPEFHGRASGLRARIAITELRWAHRSGSRELWNLRFNLFLTVR